MVTLPRTVAFSCIEMPQSGLSEVAIDALSMANLDDVHDEPVVFNSVHDAVLALTDSIAILAGELLATRRARVVTELRDPPYDTLAVLLAGNGLDLLHGRGFDQNPISSHYVSVP